MKAIWALQEQNHDQDPHGLIKRKKTLQVKSDLLNTFTMTYLHLIGFLALYLHLSFLNKYCTNADM